MVYSSDGNALWMEKNALVTYAARGNPDFEMAAAYLRVVICVFLRTAASAEAPSALILLLLILRHG